MAHRNDMRKSGTIRKSRYRLNVRARALREHAMPEKMMPTQTLTTTDVVPMAIHIFTRSSSDGAAAR